MLLPGAAAAAAIAGGQPLLVASGLPCAAVAGVAEGFQVEYLVPKKIFNQIIASNTKS